MRPQAHLLLAVTLSVCTVSIAKDVEQALAGLYSFSVPAFQCDRLMTAQAGDIGCSGELPFEFESNITDFTLFKCDAGPFDPVSGALFPVTTLADVTCVTRLPFLQFVRSLVMFANMSFVLFMIWLICVGFFRPAPSR